MTTLIWYAAVWLVAAFLWWGILELLQILRVMNYIPRLSPLFSPVVLILSVLAVPTITAVLIAPVVVSHTANRNTTSVLVMCGVTIIFVSVVLALRRSFKRTMWWGVYAISSPDEGVRLKSVENIKSELGSKPRSDRTFRIVSDALAKAITDSNLHVRVSAAETLFSIAPNDQRIVATLVSALRARDEFVRSAVC
jgi:hypothetical protein